jgi:Lanthionine synthetase C-like protein
VLYTPARHEPLGDAPWSEARARSAIEAIVAATLAGVDERTGLWPLHPNDVEPGDDGPSRGLYCGAAGIIWALEQLGVEHGFSVEPDPDGDDGFLDGRAGVLAVTGGDGLRDLVASYVGHPALELLYGSPGMMVIAHHRGFGDAWRALADDLLARRDDDGVWTQEFVPGHRDRYVGFAHGFAGNAFALAQGGRQADAIEVATRLAVVEGELANWPAVAGQPLELTDGIRTQWCHGAAGVVAAFAGIEGDDAWDELLLAGGRTVWAAGPLRDRAGLCHGTAGNAYAFLKLFERTGDELWLERARRFAMHALHQVGEPWHSLYTGDLGVALCLRSCLEADARFPTLDFL